MRERCAVVLEKAKKNELNHFDVDMSKFVDTTRFVVSIIKVRLILSTSVDNSDKTRETLQKTSRVSLLTADGSTSMSADATALQR